MIIRTWRSTVSICVTNGIIDTCEQVSIVVLDGMLVSVKLKFLIRDLEINVNEIFT